MTETKATSMTLVQELTKIQKELDKIEKDGKNNRQGFDYVSESQVKSKLQNKLADHGIMIIPHYEILNTWNGQTNKGNTMNYVSVMGTFKLTNGCYPALKFLSCCIVCFDSQSIKLRFTDKIPF